MIRHTSEVRVRYADTDQMKFAYYAKYFEYFEQGRADLMRAIGLPYSQVEDELGVLLPVIEAHGVFKSPARYDDLLKVVTILRDVPVAKVRIDYEVHRGEKDELLAEGYTVHSFVNAATGKASRAPAQFVEAVERHLR